MANTKIKPPVVIRETVTWHSVKDNDPPICVMVLLRTTEPTIGVVPGYWDKRCFRMYPLAGDMNRRFARANVSHWCAIPECKGIVK